MATHPVPLGSRVYHQALKLEITLTLSHDTHIRALSVCHFAFALSLNSHIRSVSFQECTDTGLLSEAAIIQ